LLELNLGPGIIRQKTKNDLFRLKILSFKMVIRCLAFSFLCGFYGEDKFEKLLGLILSKELAVVIFICVIIKAI